MGISTIYPRKRHTSLKRDQGTFRTTFYATLPRSMATHIRLYFSLYAAAS